jgi:site-specific recombinase XerD
MQVRRSLQERHKRLGLPLPGSTLFHSSREGLIKNLRKWFAPTLEQAELKSAAWHTLRHTYASRLVMSRVNLFTVQKLMDTRRLL